MIATERVAAILRKSGKPWARTKDGWKTEEPPILHVSFDESFGWQIWIEGENLWLPADIQELYDYVEESLISINEELQRYEIEPDFDVKWQTLRGLVRHFRSFRSTKSVRRKDEYLYEISFLSSPQGVSKILIGYSHTFSYWVLDLLLYERPFYSNEEYDIGELLSRLHHLFNQWNQKNLYVRDIF
ncbi:UNVERIFIED_ORG: hypothetical protein BDK47_11813 [Anoxybacillus amylolyticus]